MSEAGLSVDLIKGIIIGVIPILLIFVAWVFREKLGFLKKEIIWGTDYNFFGSIKGKFIPTQYDSTNAEVRVGASWRYLLFKIPKGSSPIKNLEIHIDGVISKWSAYPEIIGGEIKECQSKTRILFPSVESGLYVICISTIGEYEKHIDVSGLIAENASCKKKNIIGLKFDNSNTYFFLFGIFLGLMFLISGSSLFSKGVIS